VTHADARVTRASSNGGSNGHLAVSAIRWHAFVVDEETGIYRGEVIAMMGALADISADTAAILAVLRGEDDESEEEEEDA